MENLKETFEKTMTALDRLVAIKEAEESGFGYYLPCDPSIDKAISSAWRKLARIRKAIGISCDDD